MQSYRDFIEKYITISDESWNIFKSVIKKRIFKKNETILHIGDVCENLIFIKNGLARSYIIDEEGKDYTWAIHFNNKYSHIPNLYLIDYNSLLTNTPSDIHIEAIKDCETLIIKREDLIKLNSQLKEAEKLNCILSKEAYIYVHKLIVQNKSLNAKDRFNLLMQESPYLFDIVPQYIIASYLNITPQYLVKLKNNYYKNSETCLMK